MAIWTIPTLIVIVIIGYITFRSIQKPKGQEVLREIDYSVPEGVEEHPFTLNPIIWISLIAAGFTGIIIFYYAMRGFL